MWPAGWFVGATAGVIGARHDETVVSAFSVARAAFAPARGDPKDTGLVTTGWVDAAGWLSTDPPVNPDSGKGGGSIDGVRRF
jgi:hypothetical protein